MLLQRIEFKIYTAYLNARKPLPPCLGPGASDLRLSSKAKRRLHAALWIRTKASVQPVQWHRMLESAGPSMDHHLQKQTHTVHEDDNYQYPTLRTTSVNYVHLLINKFLRNRFCAFCIEFIFMQFIRMIWYISYTPDVTAVRPIASVGTSSAFAVWRVGFKASPKGKATASGC